MPIVICVLKASGHLLKAYSEAWQPNPDPQQQSHNRISYLSSI